MKSYWFILCAVVTLAVVAGGFLFLSQPVPQAPLSPAEPLFDRDSAFGYLEELVTDYPRRDIYHPDSRAAADWLRAQLAGFGLDTHTQEFDQFVKDGLVKGQENVYAISRGQDYPDEYILITAHYDIPPFVNQGAADNASSVAAVLELARLFSTEPHRRSMIFLMSDSEEYGAMWGVINFLQQFEQRDRIKAAIVLDYLNMGEMKALSLRSMGLQQGYSPLWLRELTLRALEQEAAVSHSEGVFEWIERAVAIAPTEAGVLLRAGIPAVNLGGVPVDREAQKRYFHTTADTIDKLLPESLGIYGRAAERALRAVDELPAIPGESMYYLKFGNRFLPGRVVGLLQLLIFLPLGLAVLAGYRRLLFDGIYNGPAVMIEIKRWLAVFIAGAAGFAVLKILPYTGLMYRYELYPATQKDPVLYHPQYLPAVAVLAAALLAFLILRWSSLWQAPPPAHRDNRKLGLMIVLFVLALATWVGKGGYAAVVFLFLPAYLWPLLPSGRSWAGRLVSLVIVLASNAVFFYFIYQFSTMYDIGVMWWYLLMGASYGLFSMQGVLAALAGFSLYLTAIVMALSGSRSYHYPGRVLYK